MVATSLPLEGTRARFLDEGRDRAYRSDHYRRTHWGVDGTGGTGRTVGRGPGGGDRRVRRAGTAHRQGLEAAPRVGRAAEPATEALRRRRGATGGVRQRRRRPVGGGAVGRVGGRRAGSPRLAARAVRRAGPAGGVGRGPCADPLL